MSNYFIDRVHNALQLGGETFTGVGTNNKTLVCISYVETEPSCVKIGIRGHDDAVTT